MIERPHYQQILSQMKDKDCIKVITGVRRSGKSTILQVFRESLQAQGISDKQVQMYNFEDLANDQLLEYHNLYRAISEKLQVDQMNYVFLDEIQMVDQFERVLDSLFIKGNVDLYVTGSNAYMLSGELATLLSGRYVEIKVMPLSFAEFYSHQIDSVESNAATSFNATSSQTPATSPETVFSKYLDCGGFPYATQIEDEQTYVSYISGIVNTVFVKDILSRKQLTNATLVEELARYLTDTSGSLVSTKKIADTLTSRGHKTTSSTVSAYIEAFLEGYLFYRCDRFDLAGKKYLARGSKYYPVDPSLRRALLGQKRPDSDHQLEGVVYLELIRRGYDVYMGTMGSYEVDFIAQKHGVTEYYQVSLSVLDEQVYTCERQPLQLIDDNFRKIILTMDPGSYNDEGIEQRNVIDWLLESFAF